MRKLETGLFLNKIPYARIGSGPDPIVVLNGGQDFVRRSSPERTARDAKRIARLLPRDRAIYVIAVLAVLHFWWLVKSDIREPALYAAIAAVLLGWRVWKRFRPSPRRTATAG